MESVKKDVYKMPYSANIDGLNLSARDYKIVFNSKLDDKCLNAKEEVLIATYPRTGTTWISQIISLLIAGEDNFNTASKTILSNRVPYLELCPRGNKKPPIQRLEDFPVPRADKTHLPYRFIRGWIERDNLPTIVTTRHPKDTIVSIYNFYKSLQAFDFHGTWGDFFEHFKAGYILYGDQLHWYQDLDKHMHQRDNILVVKFEDMKRNIEDEIRKIANFLKINTSDDFLQKLVTISSLKHMKQDSATNLTSGKSAYQVVEGRNFIHKGCCGEWKKYFTIEQNEWFDSVYKECYIELGLDVAYD